MMRFDKWVDTSNLTFLTLVDPNCVNIINNRILPEYTHLQWGVFSHTLRNISAKVRMNGRNYHYLTPYDKICGIR